MYDGSITYYDEASIKAALESSLQTILSWPTWKISSMFSRDDKIPKEILDAIEVREKLNSKDR